MFRFVRAIAFLALTLAAAAPLAGQVGSRTSVLDAGTATEAELAALPHMNAARARSVVAARPFASVKALDALLGAQGLGAEQRKELYARLFVPINLNTAPKEEILLIPGVGNRMLHEFEEYRPYQSLAVFHREIDKYVDDAELARLEQYVFVPVNLNTATDADFMTIPGLGPRMLREFKEYRPYKSIEQFRKEIGKYVDAKEVARLERYVTIK
ncbi:MAG: helix-hairpin-helix domain-containing protein [Acidobacteriota bacterium]|nr:helix-hairpin-helix domain-containing protein [Acidobacteriota bacterium]